MDNLVIKGSHGDFFIPDINFNAQSGIFEIGGESYLEDTAKFYAPVLNWLRDYTDQAYGPIIFNVKLTYFNTSSSRSILDILYILKEYEDNGGDVTINWFYTGDDYEIEEEVEDYMIDTGLKINLILMDEDEMEKKDN